MPVLIQTRLIYDLRQNSTLSLVAFPIHLGTGVATNPVRGGNRKPGTGNRQDVLLLPVATVFESDSHQVNRFGIWDLGFWFNFFHPKSSSAAARRAIQNLKLLLDAKVANSLLSQKEVY